MGLDEKSRGARKKILKLRQCLPITSSVLNASSCYEAIPIVKDDRSTSRIERRMELNGIHLPFVPVGGVQKLQSTPQVTSSTPSTPFANILQNELESLKFSNHAQARLNSRDIQLSQDDMKRLESAVTKAGEKGANDSLVMLRDMAFIVSVRNRTVITALKGEQAQNNVFTNIDSAVVA